MRGSFVVLALLSGCAIVQPTVIATKAQMRAIVPEPLPPSSTDPLPQLTDADVDARLAFLERAIAHNARDVRIWHGIWTAGYAAGILVEAPRALWADDKAHVAAHTVGAAKAVIGVGARVARPPRAVYGPSPAELVPETDRAGRTRRLLVAEAMLRLDARESDRRFQWIGHTVNVGLNLIGFLVIGLGYHQWAEAGESLGVGVLVGEISIWTQPYRAKKDWKRYAERFGPASPGPAPVRYDPARGLSERNGTNPILGITF